LIGLLSNSPDLNPGDAAALLGTDMMPPFPLYCHWAL